MFPIPFRRRGNALLLTTLILTLVIAGMLTLTDSIIGRKKLDDHSRMSTSVQDAAECVAEVLSERIASRSFTLSTDLTPTGENPLTEWLARGFVGKSSDVANVKGLWVNNCLVYWRLEPVTSYDRTVNDYDGTGKITNTDVHDSQGNKYLVNRSLEAAAATGSIVGKTGSPRQNPGLLFFELTIDAYAMPPNNELNGNPLKASTNSTSSLEERSPLHAQIKKPILVKSDSAFRYVIYYNAVGRTGDIEFHAGPDMNVTGSIHTNGAAYLNHNGQLVIGSLTRTDSVPTAWPDYLPKLKPVSFTAVDGLFCMTKYEMYKGSNLKPDDIPINDLLPNSTANFQRTNKAPHINSVQLTYEQSNVGDITDLYFPVVTGTLQNPFSKFRDSRKYEGKRLTDYETENKVRDSQSEPGAKIRDITQMRSGGVLPGYMPLEPFQMVPSGVPLKGVLGNYSILNGDSTTLSATDMLLFRQGPVFDVQKDQATGTFAQIQPDLVNMVTNDPLLEPLALGLKPSDRSDLFSNLAAYIIATPNTPGNGSPQVSLYMGNSLGLNQKVIPGVGITILERGTQASATWPSGRLDSSGLPGHVTWDPPSLSLSVIDPLAAVPQLAYDPNNMKPFLRDYCQWLRTNYVVYFGVNQTATALIDITDRFFSVGSATNLSGLLAREDVFKDRRESDFLIHPNFRFIADRENYRNNSLTLNMAAICAFIESTPLHLLDPGVPIPASGAPIIPKAKDRFNGTIYVARTSRYSPISLAPDDGTTPANKPLMLTYQYPGRYDPLAPLGYNQTRQADNQITPVNAVTDITSGTPPPKYPIIGNVGSGKVNGFPNSPTDVFGSNQDIWAVYPMTKSVRIVNGKKIDWGGKRANGRAIGLTIYTPNRGYLQGNFNVTKDLTNRFPACSFWCDSLTTLSNAWDDNAVNAPGLDLQTKASDTAYNLCLVIHNVPTDLANCSDLGSGGVHNVIRYLEDWDGIKWAFIGSLVVLDRSRYTRGFVGNGKYFRPPNRLYCFNDDLYRELPPFAPVINEVSTW